jgi:hypothetical protein
MPLEIQPEQHGVRLWQASPVQLSAWPLQSPWLRQSCWQCRRVAGQTPAKRIMMLHSFGLRFKPWTDYAETIRSEISRRARTPVIFHDHSLQNASIAG